MEQSAIPFNELVPTLRKRVHNCFLTWHRFAMVRHLKMKCAVRSESLNRGISAFKQLLMRRRARRHFQRSVMARAVKHWRSVAAAQSPPPLQRGMQVLFCYKMLSHSCQDGPTHKFPWLGNAGSVDETGSRIAAVRYRNYVMGRLELPERNVPLFTHSVAVLDAFQLRNAFDGLRRYSRALGEIRRRPIRRIFDRWRALSDRRMHCLAAAIVVSHKRILAKMAEAYWKWRMCHQLRRARLHLTERRARSALCSWRLKSESNKQSRHAFNVLFAHTKQAATGLAFAAWMTVWLNRMRMQRASNRLVCNRFDAMQRSAWVAWKGLYRSIKIYRTSHQDRLRGAAATIKSQIRAKQYLRDRDVKRGHFRTWILHYSYRVRGNHVVLAWYNHHRRRKLQRALRQWILLFSVETIAACVQKTWRGYCLRFVRSPEVWARVKWYRHYLGLCYQQNRLNAKRRVLRTWVGFLREQRAEFEMECIRRADGLALTRLRHNLKRFRYEKIANNACGVLYNLSCSQRAFGALDMWTLQRKREKHRDLAHIKQMGELFLRRGMGSFRMRGIMATERSTKRLAVKRLWFSKLIAMSKCSLYQHQIREIALRHFMHTCLLFWRRRTTDSLEKAAKTKHILLAGIAKPLFSKWTMYSLGRKFSRCPGNGRRLDDLRRIETVLLDRSDPRRQLYMRPGGIDEMGMRPFAVPMTAAAIRSASRNNGSKSLCLRKWIRRIKLFKKISWQLKRFQQIANTSALRASLNRWLCVGFSQVRWRKAAVWHYRDRMNRWRVRAAFHELHRPVLQRQRWGRTIAVQSLLEATARSFRHWKMNYFSFCSNKARVRLADIHFERRMKGITLETLFCRARGILISDGWFQGQPTIINTRASPPQREVIRAPPDSVSRQLNASDIEFSFMETPVQSPSQSYKQSPSLLRAPRDLSKSSIGVLAIKTSARLTRSKVYATTGEKIAENAGLQRGINPDTYRPSSILERLRMRMADAPQRRLAHLLPFLSLQRLVWHLDTRNAKHFCPSDVARYAIYRCLLSGMRALYTNALHHVSLRRVVRRTSLVPSFKSWFALYLRESVRRHELRKISLRITLRLARGVFMAWAFHTMKCRRLAYQVEIVQRRRRIWALRVPLERWLHLMAWDHCAHAFVAVSALRMSRLMRRMFNCWRRARLIVGSLTDALYQMTFTGWVWYAHYKRIKHRAIKKGNKHFYKLKCSETIKHWRVWAKRHRRQLRGNYEGVRHSQARSCRRHLIYWLYWAWWMGRLVLFSRRKFHYTDVNAPEQRIKLSSKTLLLSTPRRLAFSPTVKSSLRAPMSPSASASMRFANAVPSTPFRVLSDKRLPWLARRVFAGSGRRHIPGIIEACLHRGFRHWHKIAKCRMALWKLQMRRHLFLTWKRNAFAKASLRCAFVSRMHGILYSHFMGHYFRHIKRAASTNKLYKSMSSYFQQEKRREVLHAWKRVYWLRVTLRRRIVALGAIAQIQRAKILLLAVRSAFCMWRVSTTITPRLDLATLGRAVLHTWQVVYKASKFRRHYILRSVLRAWSMRIATLSKMRCGVLNMRKACSMLENRLRNQAMASVSARFDKWKSSKLATVMTDWKQQIKASKPLYINQSYVSPFKSSAVGIQRDSDRGILSFPRADKRSSYSAMR